MSSNVTFSQSSNRRIRRTVLIETEQISISADRAKQDFMICEICEPESVMLPAEKIAELTGSGVRETYRLIEAGKVHFAENGSVYVCVASLLGQNAEIGDARIAESEPEVPIAAGQEIDVKLLPNC